MTGKAFAAGLLAASVVAGAGCALAADLDYGRVPTDRYSAYEDPRYRDLYAPDPRQAYAPPPGAYYRGVPPPPVPPSYVYRPDGPYRYSEVAPDWRHRGGDGCLPREEIRHRLIGEGWREFHDLDLRDDLARVNARRPNGDLYSLKVDRCTGDIVSSRLLERGQGGPYAYENGSGRWQRPYY